MKGSVVCCGFFVFAQKETVLIVVLAALLCSFLFLGGCNKLADGRFSLLQTMSFKIMLYEGTVKAM